MRPCPSPPVRAAILAHGRLLLLGICALATGAAPRSGSEDDVAQGKPNRLVHEQSPYLQQHAHNPVDWYPWGDEALDRARREDRPIFLSIGYSTCHWCHVMERESFEDPAIAALLNENFVCIKVDREERPDLDEIYMAACQAMTGQGGWPLSIFLTPDLRPFYAGTYFPPEDRFGRPGFPRLVTELGAAYRDRRDEVDAAAGRLTDALQRLSILPEGGELPERSAVDTVADQLSGLYDPTHGGWGSAPKFPRADYGSLSLRMFRRTGDDAYLTMALTTLDRMADGGLYDHLGGGFHRYSTDAEWLAPHFEKMLYDNAQLAFHYLEAFQLTREDRYAEVARGTLDYVLRDLTHERGGFFSAEDADTEGEEGRFYVWSAAEVEEVLGDEAGLFAAAYDVTAAGNWEGKTILRRVRDDAALAADQGIEVVEVRRRLAAARRLLLERRGERVRPGLDDKVLTAWNGLAITAFARASMVLDDPRYRDAAVAAARFCLEELRDNEGLLRRWRAGDAKVRAFAEDYAMFGRGLLELYQATWELDFLEAARELHAEMTDRFSDPEDGALFNTEADQADLIVRVKTGYDGSTPTPNSVAVGNALLLFELTGEEAYARQAERILATFGPTLMDRGLALVAMVQVLDAWYAERVELVVAGDPDDPRTLDLFRTARSGYHPDLVTSLAPAGGEERAVRLMPPLEGKVAGDGPLAYVCRAFTCRQPTADPATMASQLDLLTRQGKGQ